MKRTVIHIFLLAVAVGFAACGGGADLFEQTASDNTFSGQSNTKSDGQKMRVQASTCNANVRNDLENAVAVLWSENDCIFIDGQKFTLVSGACTTDGVFEGPQLTDGSYDAYHDISGKSLPAMQQYRNGGCFAPMYTEVTVTGGKALPAFFSNLCGWLKLTVSSSEQVKASYVKFTAMNAVAGDFQTSSTDAAVIKSASVIQTVTLDCGEDGVALASGGTAFDIALPAGSYSNVMIEVTGADGTVYMHKFGPQRRIEISQSRMAAESLSATFCTRGYVDLGLSVLWATCNVGAATAVDYGDCFAWGETQGYFSGKTMFEWDNYSLNSRYNGTDGKSVLSSDDDAAHVNWRGGWRMPTETEMKELKENCYWEWTSAYDGDTDAQGYIVYKAKQDSDKGKIIYSGGTTLQNYSLSDAHIFLPAAVLPWYSELGIAVYWTSSLNSIGDDQSTSLLFNSSSVLVAFSNRCLGQYVRPVCEN